MADVNVSVVVDGKPVFVHGMVGTPDPNAAAQLGLQAGLNHFQAARAAAAPQPTGSTQSTGPSL